MYDPWYESFDPYDFTPRVLLERLSFFKISQFPPNTTF